MDDFRVYILWSNLFPEHFQNTISHSLSDPEQISHRIINALKITVNIDFRACNLRCHDLNGYKREQITALKTSLNPQNRRGFQCTKNPTKKWVIH